MNECITILVQWDTHHMNVSGRKYVDTRTVGFDELRFYAT